MQSRSTAHKTHVHSRRTPPRHPLQIRPPGAVGPTGRALASRAALPQQRHLVFAAGRAGRAFRQLDAGPVRQLPGAARVSRKDARVQGHGRPRGRNGGLQPVRLFSRAAGRELPFQVHRLAGRRACPLPRHRRTHAASFGLSRQDRAQGAAHHRLPGRPQPAGPERRQLPDPHGARRADAGRNAHQRQRLLPRLGLAPGAAAAPLRPGGAFRFGAT
jgi:hypothetical protein